MPRSSSRKVQSNQAPDPSTVDIPAALARLVTCLKPKPGTGQRRVSLRYCLNPAMPADLQRHEDRTDRVLALIQRVQAEGHMLTAGQVEACFVRAWQLFGTVVAEPQALAGDADFVGRMLKSTGLFAAVQAQKAADGLPLAVLQRTNGTASGAERRVPDSKAEIPAGVFAS